MGKRGGLSNPELILVTKMHLDKGKIIVNNNIEIWLILGCSKLVTQ